MSKFTDKLKKSIQEDIRNIPSASLAYVIKCHNDTYTADIMIVDANYPNKGQQFNGVPFPMIGGLSYAMPHVGEKVLVQFLNGDRNSPIITHMYPSAEYQIAIHSYVPDSLATHLAKLR